ncbi:hypothetical protein C8R43DRAFT_883303, partial [Mycena crocata]
PSRRLEFRVAQGWEPLCRFLGKEVPAMDFPRVSDNANKPTSGCQASSCPFEFYFTHNRTIVRGSYCREHNIYVSLRSVSVGSYYLVASVYHVNNSGPGET